MKKMFLMLLVGVLIGAIGMHFYDASQMRTLPPKALEEKGIAFNMVTGEMYQLEGDGFVNFMNEVNKGGYFELYMEDQKGWFAVRDQIRYLQYFDRRNWAGLNYETDSREMLMIYLEKDDYIKIRREACEKGIIPNGSSILYVYKENK